MAGTTATRPSRSARHPPEPVDLDELAAEWWEALAAEDSALRAGVRALGSQEVAARSHHLAEERAEAARLLRELGLELGAHSPLVAWLGGPAVTARILGLPNDALASVFDLDGVLTMSAEAHAAAWTQVFDAFLGDHAQRHHRPFFAFDPRHDYEELVAGRPRRDGIRVFLASRGVDLPEGSPSDAPGIETVYGLAQLVDVRVDGHAMAAERLEAKPAPICCWSPAASCGSSRRGQSPSETSPAGVAAARAAEFAFVVGVAWTGEADLLRASDTDIVVTDLGELLATGSTSAL